MENHTKLYNLTVKNQKIRHHQNFFFFFFFSDIYKNDRDNMKELP